MNELARLLIQAPLAVMSATLLIAWCATFCAISIVRARTSSFRTRIVIGIVIVVVAATIFAIMARALRTDPQFPVRDLAIAHALGTSIPFEVKRVFAWLTHLGDSWLLAVCCATLAAWLVGKRHALFACLVVAASGGNGLLNVTLKHLIRRARPVWDTSIAVAQGWSFPSGHTSGSLATYGAIAYVLVHTMPERWRMPVVYGAVTVVIVTAWSRVIVGVHFVSDVIAGAMSGAAWLTICIVAVECLRRYTSSGEGRILP